MPGSVQEQDLADDYDELYGNAIALSGTNEITKNPDAVEGGLPEPVAAVPATEDAGIPGLAQENAAESSALPQLNQVGSSNEGPTAESATAPAGNAASVTPSGDAEMANTDVLQTDQTMESLELHPTLNGISSQLLPDQSVDQEKQIVEEIEQAAAQQEQDMMQVQKQDGEMQISDATKPSPVQQEETTTGQGGPIILKPGLDREFLEAAQANKGSASAEWQFDSSDAESSSDSSSDSSSSDDSEEEDEDYEMLDPATAAKMLMAEEGGDDDEGQGQAGGTGAALRTKNEQPVQVVPKPDIKITDAMHVIPLGAVEHIVESYAVIRGFTPGEYQVLEQGSALCLENKTIIGVIAETLGRVQEPMYSVAFTDRNEINDLSIEKGTKIYYIQEHSSFVFTQPLKGLKGTDASNIHDEEVGDDEMEFSDDEAEAAHKRAQKLAKRGGGKFASRDVDASGQTYQPTNGADRRIISYDDEDTGSADTLPARQPDFSGSDRTRRGGFDRGRGGGRGGRGRGRGDRNDRGGRGGRGGFNHRQDAAQSQSQSYAGPPTGSFHPDMAASHHQSYPQHVPPPPPFSAYPPNQQYPVPPPPQFVNGQSQYHIPGNNPSWMQSLQQPGQSPGAASGQHYAPPPPLPPQAYAQQGYWGQQQYPAAPPQQHQHHHPQQQQYPQQQWGGQWPAQHGGQATPAAQGPDAYAAAMQQMEILRRLNGA